MTEIDIVGAGVAGLALASGLPDDWTVRLHEANWDAEAVPTSFGMWPGAMKALDDLGIGDQVRERARHLSGGRLHSRDGRVLATVEGQEVWLIARTELVQLLRDRLTSHVEVHHQRVDDATTLRADLVVGADGVHSAVRRTVWGDAPRPTGATAVRGVVSGVSPPLRLDEFWGRGQMAGMTPQANGNTNWFATVPQRHFAGVSEAWSELRALFSDWPEPFRHVLEAARPADTAVNDLWSSRWPRRLVRGATS